MPVRRDLVFFIVFIDVDKFAKCFVDFPQSPPFLTALRIPLLRGIVLLGRWSRYSI